MNHCETAQATPFNGRDAVQPKPYMTNTRMTIQKLENDCAADPV
jgi:hypothetical protein